MTIGLVIDSSISMFQIRDLLIESAVAFAHASNTRDEVFALAFNERSWPALPADAPFTSDPVILGPRARPRDRASRTHGTLRRGRDRPRLCGAGSHNRKVLAIVSDGGDNASTATAKDILTRLQSSSIVVYTVALIDPIDREANPSLMRQLASATGGEASGRRRLKTFAAPSPPSRKTSDTPIPSDSSQPMSMAVITSCG